MATIIKSASKSLWQCLWFPLKETRPGGDAVNNLFARGGALDKFDDITNAGARAYEFSHNRKSSGSGSEFDWWRHSKEAAHVSCLLDAPKANVIKDGVRFSPNDIQGLLVKVIGGLIFDIDSLGNPYDDCPDGVSPADFVEKIQEWMDGIG